MKKLFIVLFILVSTFSLYGLDWQEAGLTVQSQDEDDNSLTLLVEGNPVTIRNAQNATEDTAEAVKELTETFYGFEMVSIDSLTYNILNNGSIRIVLIPSSCAYNNRDMMENVASGFGFLYESRALTYNFRMRSNNMFLRISGAYIDEEMLLKKMDEALSDPQAFIARRDADYILSRIERIENKIDQLEARDMRHDRVDQQLTNTDKNLIKNDKIIVNNLKKLQAEDDKIRFAMISFQNNEWFAGETPVEKEIIKEVLSIYKSNKSLDYKGIHEICKEREIEVSLKEVKIILITYENVIEEK